jgi:hypothetical protein
MIRPARTRRWNNPHPTINERLSAYPSCPVKERRAEAKSKTSLRLIPKPRGAVPPYRRGNGEAADERQRILPPEFPALAAHFCARLSLLDNSIAYEGFSTLRQQKCRYCRAVSLRISRKAAPLRDRTVTVLFSAPTPRRAKGPIEVRCGGGKIAPRAGCAHPKGRRDHCALSDSSRISDTCASPPDSSPLSPHLGGIFTISY